jgi:hypothetical protein
MKNLKVFGAVALMGAGLVVFAGCKSAPPLAQADAQKMIEAKYAADPAVPVSITVNDPGMQQGANAKLWARTKVYPNRYWADFTLTPDGKKAIKLAKGDAIEWRPSSTEDKSYVVVIQTAQANHPKIKDIQAPQEAGDTRTVAFTEAVNLDGVDSTLQAIAHNPGNKLSEKKTATFVLDGDHWKLDSIQ